MKSGINKFFIFFFSLMLVSSGFHGFLLAQSDNSVSSTSNNNFVPGELLIQLKNSDKIYKIKYSDNPNPEKLKEIILDNSSIARAEPNYRFKISYLPSDPLLGEQWNLSKIKAPQAWDIAKGGTNDVVIAVLDTGVDINHPDLKANIWINDKEILGNGIDDDRNGYIDDYYGWDFVRDEPGPQPKFDEPYNAAAIHHGTIVSGLIAAIGDNNQGVAGIAWKSKIMALRVLDSEGNGSVDSVIRAVNYAISQRANIINLSFVGSNKSDFLAQALKRAWQAGLVIVAAAGNEATGQTEDLDQVPAYPICLDSGDTDNYIIGVTATDQNDQKGSYSNYGSRCIDISAPGSRVYGLMDYNPSMGDDFKEYYGGYWSGTSVAVPLVSGAAALLKAVNPLISNVQIRNILMAQADNIDLLNVNYTGKLGAGRLNVYRAVDYVYSQLLNLPQPRYVVTAAGSGGGPHIKVLKSNGIEVLGFMAYDEKFKGGVKISTGDVDGDGEDEIITLPASGNQSMLKIFDSHGQLKNQFSIINKEDKFKGGNLTVADIDGDNKAEILVAAGSGSVPYIYVYNFGGELELKFLAYANNFLGGFNVAVGDIDKDGVKEIVTAPQANGGPHVRIFTPEGWVKYSFFAFLKTFRGGINLAVGDLNNDGQAEIITTIASKASPFVRVFNQFGDLRVQYLAYDRNFNKGVNIAAGDLNDDGLAEVIVGPGFGGGPHIRIFDYYGDVKSQFFAYPKNFLGGVSVATIKIKE